MENKFKVGDRVRIRAWDDMEKEFGLNFFNTYIDCQGGFTKSMRYLCGKTAIIQKLGSYGYVFLNFDNCKDTNKWAYSTDMLEPLESEKILITFDGNITTARRIQGKKTIGKAYAKCNPIDVFDSAVGAELALERLMKKELSVGDIVTVTNTALCYPRCTDWVLKYAPEYAVFFKFDTPLPTEPDELPYTVRTIGSHLIETNRQLCLIQRNEFIPEKGPCYVIDVKALKKVSG